MLSDIAYEEGCDMDSCGVRGMRRVEHNAKGHLKGVYIPLVSKSVREEHD